MLRQGQRVFMPSKICEEDAQLIRHLILSNYYKRKSDSQIKWEIHEVDMLLQLIKHDVAINSEIHERRILDINS